MIPLMLALLMAGPPPASATISGPSVARTVRVPARDGALSAALAAVRAGDTLLVARGVHRGTFRVERSIVLRGEQGTVLEGTGQGTVLQVVADGVRIEHLEIRHSGRRVITIDSGIHVVRSANVTVRDVTMRDVLYGIYGERAAGLRVEACRLEGRVPPFQEDGEGDGIHLWYCGEPVLAGNHVQSFVDGVYLSFVNGARVEANTFERCGRYGLHTMYCQNNALIGNHFQRNSAGCAIMFSNHLEVLRNDFLFNRGPRTYGLLLRDCSDGRFEDNRLVDNTIAIFMDGSNRNHIRRNLLQDNGWGILMFSSCAGNVVSGNGFLNNDYSVALDMRRSDNRFDDGDEGNYWSENAAYDLGGDGVSDVAFSPVTTFAFLSKQYPDLSVLAKSPAVAALGVAERLVPAMRPSDVVDHRPRVTPVHAAGTGDAVPPAMARRVAAPAIVGFAMLTLLGITGLSAVRRSA